MDTALSCVVMAGLMLAGCAGPGPPISDGNCGPWVSIAMVSGTDVASQRHAEHLLANAGILSGMDGSVIYGISVPSQKAAQARECLVACEPGDDTGWLVAPEDAIRNRKVETLDTPLAEALSRKDLAPDVQEALRHPETAARSREYPVLLQTAEWDRHWLSAGGRESSWHEVEVTLGSGSEGERRTVTLGFFERDGRFDLWSLAYGPLSK